MNISTLDSWINNKICAPKQKLETTDLEAWQVNQFNRSLAMVKEKSSFYRQHFNKFPDKISNLIEIQQFPFTSEADIRFSPQRFVCVSQNEIERVVTLTS